MHHALDSYMNFIYPIYMECIILPKGFRFTSKNETNR